MEFVDHGHACMIQRKLSQAKDELGSNELTIRLLGTAIQFEEPIT